MSVIINTNVQSLIAQRSLANNTNALTQAMERLSTGFRVNSAKDDATGVGVSELMSGQIRGNSQAMTNIQDGLNMLNVAEGGLSVITEDVQRIRELCVQAASELYDENSRQAILNEIEQRLKAINNTANSTNFNGKNLLNGTHGSSLAIQIGPNGDSAGTTINSLDVAPSLTNATTSALDIDLKITALGKSVDIVTNGVDGSTWTTANIRLYIGKLDTALETIAANRSQMGAYMNGMESAYENLSTINTGLQEAVSRIKDVDIAETSSDMVKYQILQQTSVSILSQANQMPSIALKLLGS